MRALFLRSGAVTVSVPAARARPAPDWRGGTDRRDDGAGFTLLELLAAVAIIAVLAGLILPTLGAARAAALKARTKLQFDQWIGAMELYREEYGAYPAVGTDGKLASAADAVQFVRTLAGTNPDGSPVAEAADLNGNLKRRRFCEFAPADFIDPDRPGEAADYSGNELLCDAFGNTEIGVAVDRNGDGFIRTDDDGPFPAVRAAGGRSFAPDAADLPPTGVRAGVLLYSAGRGGSAQDMVLSWR